MATAVALALGVTALLAGCAGDKLTADQQVDLPAAQAGVAALCLGYLEGGPSAEDANDGREAIDTLVAIYRDKPDAEHDGRTVRQIVSDEASHLEECGARTEASRLDRALDADP